MNGFLFAVLLDAICFSCHRIQVYDIVPGISQTLCTLILTVWDLSSCQVQSLMYMSTIRKTGCRCQWFIFLSPFFHPPWFDNFRRQSVIILFPIIRIFIFFFSLLFFFYSNFNLNINLFSAKKKLLQE